MFKVNTAKGTVEFGFAHYRDVNASVGNLIIRDVSICKVRIPDGRLVMGVASCSTSDVFNKEVGRRLALQRALTRAKLDRTIRREVWQRYHDRHVTNDEYNGTEVAGTNLPTPDYVGVH